jgi:hypothetical protein
MAIFRHNIFLLVFMLIMGCRLVAFSAPSEGHCPDFADTAELENASTIEAPTYPVYLEIEVNNLLSNITEVHRLSSVSVLPNQIAPNNYPFRSSASASAPVKYCPLVPIFILGHALLN